MKIIEQAATLESPTIGTSSGMGIPDSGRDLAKVFIDVLKMLFGNTSWNKDFGTHHVKKSGLWIDALNNI